jgi:hypothetical protein
MPQWMHDRARHIQAKNPEMPESEAFAIATQQSHALGKSPSGFGTEEGHRKAKLKYTTPGDDKKTADPGGLGKEAGIGGRVKSFLGDAAAEGVRKRYEGPAKKILTGAGIFAGGTALGGHNLHKRVSRLEKAHADGYPKMASVTFLAPLTDSFCDELEKIAIAVPQSMAMATQSPLGAVKTTVPKDTLKKSTTYSKVNSSPTVSPIAQHQPVLDAPPVRT